MKIENTSDNSIKENIITQLASSTYLGTSSTVGNEVSLGETA